MDSYFYVTHNRDGSHHYLTREDGYKRFNEDPSCFLLTRKTKDLFYAIDVLEERQTHSNMIIFVVFFNK